MTLLVIGGGIAGLAGIVGIRKYDEDVKIILVEPKDFMEVLWASYRSPFDAKVAKDSTYLLEPFLTKHRVTHIRATVKELLKDKAVLNDDGNKVIEFDVCLVAVGAPIPWSAGGNGLPQGYDGSRDNRLVKLQQEGEKITNSKHVVVIGGGLIGAEVAGDIAAYSKNETKVTLVHSGDTLCHQGVVRAAAGKMIERQLTKGGVDVVLQEKATIQDGGRVVLNNSGKELHADHVIRTTGLVPKNEFVRIEGALNERGFLITDDFLLVEGGEGRVFGFGDCCTALRNAGTELLENQYILGHNIKAALDKRSDNYKEV
eukprot:CAMPEP_0118716214 /NCGR_PEP_ID=MMETSP0800-20121206/27365_1 /TAXON_ID=210618 ORGANISM="Striatella unipunctata, Strain CCMP2910" /NCGR_SAMPLE_ID=MMETSP0800 /ASSEMBLY_ACC=CAM_ASM_000638 /LENGTH=314 /DNA_ID=CAMNT_0006622587 /DNA_START=165 /DNA_END=1106 /DNA_ORIENTATION=-